LTAASKNWIMRVETRPSCTDSRGRIIRIQDLIPGAFEDGRHHDSSRSR
jgi:hypothetical protein